MNDGQYYRLLSAFRTSNIEDLNKCIMSDEYNLSDFKIVISNVGYENFSKELLLWIYNSEYDCFKDVILITTITKLDVDILKYILPIYNTCNISNFIRYLSMLVTRYHYGYSPNIKTISNILIDSCKITTSITISGLISIINGRKCDCYFEGDLITYIIYNVCNDSLLTNASNTSNNDSINKLLHFILKYDPPEALVELLLKYTIPDSAFHSKHHRDSIKLKHLNNTISLFNEDV